MKVLVTGGSGQLGYHLQKQYPKGFNVIAPGRDELDLSSADSIQKYLNAQGVDAIINAGAYTGVDAAEKDAEVAERVNTIAPKIMAEYCRDKNIPLIQISTDFVFDGTQGRPYAVDDQTNALGVYGQTKLAAEQHVLSVPKGYVLRTAWVYSEHGANFIKTMLRLAGQRSQLGVVADQVGSPTYAANLASAAWALLQKEPSQRLFHYSDAGICSWYDFALAAFELGAKKGLIEKAPEVAPLTTEQYPTPAVRPSYSVLDKTLSYDALGVAPIHWRSSLEEMLDKLKEDSGVNE